MKEEDQRSDRRFIQPPNESSKQTTQNIFKYFEEKSYIKQYKSSISTIIVPIFLRAYLIQLVSVSAADETIKARFSIYITIRTKFNKNTFQELKKKDGWDKKNKITQQGLLSFLRNNLSLQCGDEHIEISDPSQDSSQSSTYKNQSKSSNRQSRQQPEDSQQDSDDDEANNDAFFVTKQDSFHKQSKQYSTWMIDGVFNCDYELQNTFFPFMNISSGLRIVVNDQKYWSIKIKYEFMDFCPIEEMGLKVFDFKINQKSHTKFGIYTLNMHSSNCQLEKSLQEVIGVHINAQAIGNHSINLSLKENTKKENVNVNMNGNAGTTAQTKKNSPSKQQVLKKQDYSHQNQKALRNAVLSFEVLSFNLPFIMRYQIPIWTLSFASIMLYFANAQSLSNIFANIILISVSQIFLYSNFRRDKFKTDHPSMYEASLILCLAASLLLLVDSTDNFQKMPLQTQIIGPPPNHNAYTNFFFIAISISVLTLLLNIVVIAYYGCRIKSLTYNPLIERNHRLCSIWNSDIFDNFFFRYFRQKEIEQVRKIDQQKQARVQ